MLIEETREAVLQHLEKKLIANSAYIGDIDFGLVDELAIKGIVHLLVPESFPIAVTDSIKKIPCKSFSDAVRNLSKIRSKHGLDCIVVSSVVDYVTASVSLAFAINKLRCGGTLIFSAVNPDDLSNAISIYKKSFSEDGILEQRLNANSSILTRNF